MAYARAIGRGVAPTPFTPKEQRRLRLRQVTTETKGDHEVKMGMVRPEGVEPPTYWFVASCSIQLSYGRTLRGMQLLKDNGIHCLEQTAA